MQFNLKVKVLKKSKDAPYPEHIIVERKSTHELVHLYFDDGNLERLTYIARDPKIQMILDKKEKKLLAIAPNYLVLQDSIRKKNVKNGILKYTNLKGPTSQSFFIFLTNKKWKSRTIAFQSLPDTAADFFVEMDLNNRCLPNAYLGDYGLAEIQEIYPHQKRKVHPLSFIITQKSSLLK